MLAPSPKKGAREMLWLYITAVTLGGTLALITWWHIKELKLTRLELEKVEGDKVKYQGFNEFLIEAMDVTLQIQSSTLEELRSLVPDLLYQLTGCNSQLVVEDGEKFLLQTGDDFLGAYRIKTKLSRLELDAEPKADTEMMIGKILVAVENRVLDYHHLIRDGLTNLYGYAYFHQALTSELSRAARHGHSVSVILLDIDYFKQVNDSYGHLVGDQALRVVSQVLAKHHRRYDTVARLGGDEFAVLLPETELNQAARMAKMLKKEICQQEVEITGTDSFISLTLSIGVASFPATATESLLFKCADDALYKSKRTGRNRISIADLVEGGMGA